MQEKFPQSRELKELIESHGWALYDSTIPKRRKRPFTWEEFEKRGPAEEFINGRNYLFAPISKNGMTLRQAYANAGCMGPCMQINRVEEHTDMDGDGAQIVNGKITYVFSRLGVEPYKKRDAIGLFTPPNLMPDAPTLLIPFEYVLDKFQKHFRIITPEEYHVGLECSEPRPGLN
jgi:hypothetical protein